MSSSPSERTPLLSGKRSNGHGGDHGAYTDLDGTQGHGASSPATASGTATPNSARTDDVSMPPMRHLIPLCTTVWVPVLVASVDSTIVATLVGPVSSSFNRSEQAAWLGTSYLLSVCCFTPIYGRLCDAMGRKYAILMALLTFGTGTLLCGVAPSMEALIAARVIAGIGGGGLTTCTSLILSDVIPLRNRGLFQGLTNIIYGLGTALGGPLGGVSADTIGWRNAFLVQMPFIGIAIIMCAIFVHSTPPALQAAKSADPSTLTPAQRIAVQPSALERIKSIDFLGSLTLVGCVAPILLALSFMASNDANFSDAVVWCNLVVGCLSAVAFYFVETRVAKNPVLPISLLTQRNAANVAVANFCLSIVTYGVLYNYPILLQATRLQSATLAGLHLIPNSIALSLGSVFAGIWMRRTGRYYGINLFNAMCMVLSAALVLCLSTRSPEWFTYVAIIPHGFGCSGVLTATLLALINSVPRSEMAVATGLSYLFRTTGQVIGVAGTGVILQAMLKRELRARLGDEDLVTKVRHQLSIIDTLPAEQRASVIDAYSIALRVVFVFNLVAALGTAVSSYCLEDNLLPEAAPAQSSRERPHDAERPARDIR